MKLLALESADGACSLALLVDDECQILALPDSRDSLSWLLREAGSLLADAGLGWQALDGIACCVGPGGFTGVRVGVGLAQGWGLAAQLPIAGISSLAALAWAAGGRGHRGPLRVALDARMGELYAGHFSVEPGAAPEPLAPEALLTPEALQSQLEAEALAGPGFEAHPETFPKAPLLAGIRVSAEAIGRIAALGPATIWRPAAELQPTYLRNEVAQTLAQRGL